MTRREGASYDDNTGALLVTLGSGGTIPSPTFTGQSNFAAGSAGAPSIYSSSITNGATTGIYWSGNGQINLTSYTGAILRVGGGDAVQISSAASLGWGAMAGTADVTILRAAANSLTFAGATAGSGAVTSRTEINKAVTAFTNAAAKTVLTITIPNAAHSASILVRVTGSLGAGGAIGANEATASNGYIVSVTRTAGVNATAAISAAFGAAATAVAGAATVTAVATLDTVSGAVGDPNTIAIQVTITRSGGSSDNHTAVVTASLLNANATGITIA